MNNSEMEYGPEKDLSIFADTMVEMTWVEVKKSVEDGAVVLFPVGVVEEHGPHMDLSPDIYMAYLFCKFLRRRLKEKGIPSIIAPPYYWGISNDVKDYPGTFSVRPETMKAMLVDIFDSLHSWGFKDVFIVNAHGDQTHVEMIERAAREAREKTGLRVCPMGSLDLQVDNPPIFPPPREGRFEPDYHAGANETAAMYAFYPQKVNVNIAKELKPQNTFHPLGYCGDPAGFLKEETVMEYFKADLEMDALRIAAILREKGV